MSFFFLTRQAAFACSRPNIWNIHQRPRGLSQWLVMNCVCRCGCFLLGSFSEIILCEEHGWPVVWKRGHNYNTVRDYSVTITMLVITVIEVPRSRRLTDGLHGVSLLDEELSSGDVDVHAERLLLLVQRVWWPCVFAGSKQSRCTALSYTSLVMFFCSISRVL